MRIYATEESGRKARIWLRILGWLLVIYGLVYPHLYRINPMIYSYLSLSGGTALGVGILLLLIVLFTKKKRK